MIENIVHFTVFKHQIVLGAEMMVGAALAAALVDQNETKTQPHRLAQMLDDIYIYIHGG